MPALLDDSVLDFGLNSIKQNADYVHVLSGMPATYSDIATYSVGNWHGGAGNVIPNPINAGAPSGRQITTATITSGSITSDGTAAYWAIIDSGNSLLQVANALSSGQGVTSGNTWTLAPFTIRLPNIGG